MGCVRCHLIKNKNKYIKNPLICSDCLKKEYFNLKYNMCENCNTIKTKSKFTNDKTICNKCHKNKLIETGFNKCTGCDETKSIDEFLKSDNYFRCKACRSKRKKEYYQRPEVKIKERKHFLNNYIKRTYGITHDQYNEMVSKQNNKCAICKQYEKNIHHKSKSREALAIDHCHRTKKIRGLLCRRCNQGLGVFKDDVELLKKCIEYLENNFQ